MKVSIIIPCYNSENSVERAVNSALAQTYDDIEIILIDNASTDNTLNKIKELEYLYPYKIQVLQESKKGAASARNRGLKEASGTWIQFLDADDFILAEKIQNQINLAVSTSDLVVGNYLVVNNIGVGEVQHVVEANSEPWVGLISSKLGITSSNLFFKEALDAIGGWKEDLESSQEYELMFRLLKENSKVVFSPQVETLVYKQRESVSNSSDNKKAEIILKNILNLRRRIKDFLISTRRYSNELDRVYSEFVFKKLWMYRDRLPNYFAENIKKEKLDVPFILRGKIVANYYLRALRKLKQ